MYGVMEMSISLLIQTESTAGSDTFPDTEVAESPTGHKTQGQFPSNTAQLLNASRDGQHPAPEVKGNLKACKM